MKLLVLLIAILMLTGCDAFQDADPYPFQVLEQGIRSGIRTPTEEVIDTRTEWEQFWQRHIAGVNPPPPLPHVDFNTLLLVALYGGDKPTNGYSIEVVSVRELDNDIRVDYRLSGSGGPQPTLTQPFAILKMARPLGRISIRRLPDRP